MPRKRGIALLVLTSWLAFGGCHQPENPPVEPKPIDPTNGRGVAFVRTNLIDASILSDGGGPADAMPFTLDTGAVDLRGAGSAQR